MTDKSIKSILNNIKAQLKDKNCKSKKTIDLDFTVNETNIARPIIYIPLGVQKVIEEIVEQSKDEVAWNCTVAYDKDTYTFTLTDVLMFPQIVSGTAVDVDEDKYVNFISSLTDDQLNTMRFHGHSHVYMSVFSSGTDDDYQRQMLTQIDDFYIFGIFNKRKDVAMYVYDIKKNLMFSGNDVIVRYDAAPENAARTIVQGLLNMYVTKKTPAPAYSNNWKAQHSSAYDYHTSYVDRLLNGGREDD